MRIALGVGLVAMAGAELAVIVPRLLVGADAKLLWANPTYTALAFSGCAVGLAAILGMWFTMRWTADRRRELSHRAASLTTNQRAALADALRAGSRLDRALVASALPELATPAEVCPSVSPEGRGSEIGAGETITLPPPSS